MLPRVGDKEVRWWIGLARLPPSTAQATKRNRMLPLKRSPSPAPPNLSDHHATQATECFYWLCPTYGQLRESSDPFLVSAGVDGRKPGETILKYLPSAAI